MIKKIEYKEVIMANLDDLRLVQSILPSRILKSAEAIRLVKERIQNDLDKLGQDGWELVHVNGTFWLFKREVEEGKEIMEGEEKI